MEHLAPTTSGDGGAIGGSVRRGRFSDEVVSSQHCCPSSTSLGIEQRDPHSDKQINCRKNCQAVNSRDVEKRSEKDRSRYKGTAEQWTSRSPLRNLVRFIALLSELSL